MKQKMHNIMITVFLILGYLKFIDIISDLIVWVWEHFNPTHIDEIDDEEKEGDKKEGE